MLTTIALLIGLALALGAAAALLRSGGERGALPPVDTTGSLADPERVAVLHGAQPTPDFGPPPPSITITDYTDGNHLQLSAEEL